MSFLSFRDVPTSISSDTDTKLATGREVTGDVVVLEWSGEG